MEKLEAALVRLEAEIFAEDLISTDIDEFLVRALSQWSAAERITYFASLIPRYGKPDFGTQVVHALARLICRDVESRLANISGRVKHPPG